MTNPGVPQNGALPSGATTPITHPPLLTPEQRERIAKAKAYAREQTLLLLKDRKIPSPIPGAIPIHLPQSLLPTEIRSLSIMSRIYIGSIPFDMTDSHVRDLFSQFGSVKNVTLTVDPLTGKHKGYCFVEFDYPESAQLALEVMNGFDLGG
ncbi:Poly(U)-binding-splicing factor puf60, partial [Chytridiales sp. JEL 0842]